MKMNTKEKQIAQGAKRIRKTGIDIIGDAPWGTHFCQFYQTKEDLLDILVPYFKAGLENNEFCMWVTSEPLSEEEAKKEMRKAVPNFDQHLRSGQIEIVPHTDWYLKDGAFNLQRVLNAWTDKLNFALTKGYDGIRVTGNTAWLEKRDWRNFADYEEEINNVIGKYKMMAICSYSLDKCGASELIDVVKNHQFALIRREGEWALIESSERKLAEENLRQSENKYRTLVENLPQKIFLKDKNSVYVSCNENYARDLKIKPEEIAGKTDYDFYPRELAEKYRADDQRIMRLGNTEDIEERYIQNGRELWVHTVKTPIKDEKGQCIGLLGIFRDITERKKAEEALKASEEKYRSLVQNIPDVVWTTDINGKTIFISPNVKEIYGYTSEEIYKGGDSTWFDRIHPDDVEKVKGAFISLFEKGELFDAEYRIQRKDKDWIWLRDRATNVYEKNGIKYADGVFSNITERKRVEEEIRNLAKFPSENPNPVLRIAKDKTVLYANGAAEAILSEDNVKAGHHISGLWPQWTDEVLKLGVVRTDIETRHGDRVFSWTMTPVIDKDYLNVYGIDVTERKRAEEQIAYQAQLLAIVNDTVVASDAQYRLTAWNAAAESMYGWKAEEVLGRFGLDITHTEFPGVDKAEMLRAIAERGSWRGEATQARKDGTRFPVEVSSVVLRDATGEVTGFVSVNRDITERKHSEEEIRKKNEELEAFVYMVSHDLKNPVVSIQGFCSSILKNQRDELNEKTLFYLQRVQANASLMSNLLEDLVELSRIGRIEDKKTEISVQQVIKSVWDGVSRSLPTGDVEFILPKNLPRVLYSEKRLYQIFSNLLSNALKFRDEDRKTKVEIGHQEDKDNYTFFVRDNGIGIEQKYHNKIFESFSQLKDIKSEGTGMGLAIVKKIVEANQGKVWVESQKKAGSTFYFTIPKKA